MADEGVAIYES